VWSYLPEGTPLTYGDVFLENEREFSAYNFEVANVEMMRAKFDDYERECHRCLEAHLPLPAYDCVLKCSHAFNLLDSRGALSVTERTNYILRVRTVAKASCEAYLAWVCEPEAAAAAAAAGDAEKSCEGCEACPGDQTVKEA
jgi:glycyl-tRNA synthetase alpha chain